MSIDLLDVEVGEKINWNQTVFVAKIEEFTKDVEWFQTTIPENINHYLQHRDVDADSVINITVDGGIYRVFYKKTRLKEVSSEPPKIETRR